MLEPCPHGSPVCAARVRFALAEMRENGEKSWPQVETLPAD